MTDNDKAFSSIDFVGQCLVDEERTNAFSKAIEQTIKENDTVLDLGTGSGIMAILAARSKAKKVFAVEFDPFIASIAKKNFNSNGFENQIELIVQDARILSLQEKGKINVVIAEMLTTGMVDEHQVQAINNLHKSGVIDAETTVIPQRQDTYVELMEANFSLYDNFSMNMIIHLWKWHDWKVLKLKRVSNKVLLNSIVFNKINDEKTKVTLELEATQDGFVNSICLTSMSILTDDITLENTEALNAPMLIPINGKAVVAGEKLKIEIEYVFGDGYQNFRAEIVD